MTNYLRVWKLSPEDIQTVIEMAKQRRIKSIQLGGEDPYFNVSLAMEDMAWEINSFGAEIAYQRLTKGIKAVEGAPWDVLVDGLHKVDVKWSPWDHGVLLVKDKNWSRRPGWFAMMIGTFPVYEYRGRIEANVLLARQLDSDPKYVKPGYTAEQSELDLRLEFLDD